MALVSGGFHKNAVVKFNCGSGESFPEHVVAQVGKYTIKALTDSSSQPIARVYDGTTIILSAALSTVGANMYFINSWNRMILSGFYLMPPIAERVEWFYDDVYTPNGVGSGDTRHARDSDTQNTITFGMIVDTSYAGCYERHERSVDGGAWAQIYRGLYAGPGYNNQAYAKSPVVDSGCSPNHTYAYRLVVEKSGDRVQGESVTTHNTPSATGTPTVTKTGDTSAHLAFSNSANSELGTKIQRTTDNGATFVDVATTAANATTYDDLDVPFAVAIKYRTVNVAGALESTPSAWSNALTTITPPYAPTLTDKPDNYVSKADGSVLMKWLHNTADGSAQSAAEIEVTAATVQTYSVTTTETYSLSLAAIASMQGVSWRVRTKGLHADFGPWSDPDTFTVANPPQAIVTYPPTDLSVENDVPVDVTFDYADAGTFELAQWTLDLYKDDERVHTYSSNTHEAYPLGLDTYMPENDTDYRIVISVRSGSGLTGSVERLFAVAYEPPATPDLEYGIDTEAASVRLATLAGTDGETTPATDHLSVVRLDPDGSVLVLADNVAPGTMLTDALPLLNVETLYRVYSHAANGVVAYRDVPVTVEAGPYFFWNFGTEYAKFAYNADFGDGYDTDKAMYHPIGRKHPTSYYGSGRTHTISVRGDLYEDPAGEKAFADLADFGGDVVYRDPRGGRMNVSADVKTSERAGARIVSVSVAMTQVD